MSDISRRQRLQGDEGTVLLETAMVTPIIIIFLLGIFEASMMLYNSVNLTSTIRLTARSVANGAAATPVIGEADFLALTQMKAETGRLQRVTITKVIIYETDSAGTANLANCKAVVSGGSNGQGISDICNVYLGGTPSSQLQTMTAANFTASGATNCGATAWDRFWCTVPNSTVSPTQVDRNANLNSAGGTDFFGVYIEATYTYITRFFPGSNRQITDNVIWKVEPSLS